ncbi:FAD-binding, type 2 [Metarhizium album ARSEF 1941]|uniref:FAD-binding, type 2 n=1 Tax=Metarhizium album (strain ARSEF 1941) TaxID=1081103 RepID=A0A0B2X394_METAS|nr:FAD-binding, type 2 [Metarhizium album ARSEF 1941]KHN99755.1 FAD-binding, type 2 [Metarhizium album ARSEF 1941]
MGNGQSSPLQQCLNTVCSGRGGCAGYPSDPLYQTSWVKPYNAAIKVTPIAVIRPNTADEVAAAVKCAVQCNVHVQAKSGGHSYGNFGQGGQDGSLMIDMANFKNFSMDTTTWQATFGAGIRLGELDKHLQKNGGRAMAHGTCPGVGAGGHATIGGIGPSSRMWGTALDHVLAVEVVTADGRVLTASERENSDLFWAVRGAGASFGVVTRFTVRTQPAPGNVVEHTYSFSFGKQHEMAPVYAAWQALVNDPGLDRRFSTLFIAQPLGAVITATFFGTKHEYEATGIPAKMPAGGSVHVKLVDWLGSLAHIAEKAALGLADTPTPFYSKSLALRQQDALSPDTIARLFNYTGSADAGTPLWTIIFDSEGGAINQVPVDSTSYPHRDKLIMYQSYVISLSLSDKNKKFAQDIHQIIQNGSSQAVTRYAGYVDPELGRAEAQQTYWGARLPRLRQIKQKWDPDNVFQNPQSVDPAEKY